MLKCLDNERKQYVLRYCEERFGIRIGVFDKYNWYIGSKNRIYIGPGKIERIIPESIGLCIFRLDKTAKPTTNFIQLFSKEIKKNIINLGKEDAENFCNGLDLTICPKLDIGFVCVKYEGIGLGCAHWNGEILRNQVPKSRFCKINFL